MWYFLNVLASVRTKGLQIDIEHWDNIEKIDIDINIE